MNRLIRIQGSGRYAAVIPNRKSWSLGQPPEPQGRPEARPTNRFHAYSLQDVYLREKLVGIFSPFAEIDREAGLDLSTVPFEAGQAPIWSLFREITAWPARTAPPADIFAFMKAVESPTDDELYDIEVADRLMSRDSTMVGGLAGRGTFLINFVPEVDTGLSHPWFELRFDVPLEGNWTLARNIITVERVLSSFSPEDMFPWPGPRFAFYKAWSRFAIRNDGGDAILTLIEGPEIETYDVDDFVILSMFLPEDGERYNNIQSLAQEFVEEKIKKKKRAALIRGIVLAVIGLVTGAILVGVALVVASELIKELNKQQKKDLAESFNRIAEQFDDFPAFQEKINALADRVGVGTDAEVPGVAELGLVAGLGLGILWLLS